MSALPGPADSPPRAVCFHCGLPAAAGGLWRAKVLGELREFCCVGCLAAAEAIAAGGLGDYYRLRTENAPAGGAKPADDALFDRPEIQAAVVRRVGDLCEVSLALEGIRCPACLWLNEQRLRALPGVVDAGAIYASQTARVRWDPSRVELSRILGAVREIGYEARPLDASHRAALDADAARRDTPRLVFAGFVGMMVMNLAVAAYLLGGPGADGRLPLWETFARFGEAAGCLVLLAYPGQDFFRGAWRDLRRRRAGMDTPIALGLAAAWIGGAAATLRGAGAVYFDAVAMLVFFVLLARAFETRARLAAAASLDRLSRVAPAMALRLDAGGRESPVAALDLAPGDVIRVRPGDVVPADGELVEGESSFDEAVLTGEPWPRARRAGDAVVAGSANREQPVLVRVTGVGEGSTLGEIRRLMERGLASRPPSAELADRVAPRLVAAVLAIAAATALLRASSDPASALPAAVAVLIVTCPCALALATPLALALCAGRLARIGVVPARMARIEALAGARTAAFDKTGTLTLDAPRLVRVAASGGLDPEGAVETASALEAASEHPIARAFEAAAGGPRETAREPRRHPGEGVSGIVRGVRWWLGSPRFAAGPAAISAASASALREIEGEGRLAVLLADRNGREAVFALAEELRPGASELVAELRREGIGRAALLSGDASERVARIGRALGFDEALGGMTAAKKVEWVRARESAGERVLFAGDGLNDAPTLAAASVSVSFGRAPQLSRLAGDFVILSDGLGPLAAARRIAARSRRLLRQNVFWALSYNVVAVPLAALGLLAPWAAALGMSASSLIVVANAMRLARPAAGEALSGGAGPA
jgi:Cu2+-exporting ATPase